MNDKMPDIPSKGNILVVDDTPANLRLLSGMLAEQGYKVRSVINGQMALTATQAAPPDLILLDINMPEMNGYEVCERLKADEDTRDIPIIFISALDATEDKVKAFTIGGLDYITKPFQIEEVLARVETHLALRNLQKRLQSANRRFEQELALAGEVQASFLPKRIPDVPGWQLAVTLKPARETSGDFYDINLLPNGELGILVADVVGKGVGAALYMALSWTLIRTYAAEYPTQPELVCETVNRRILGDTQADMFVTAFYGVLNPATGTLIYCNAGQNPPHLFDAQKGGGPQKLSATGKPLGMFEDETWEKSVILLAREDVLVLYTDGVVEAQDVGDSTFGEDRLLRCVQSNLGHPAQVIRDAIIADVYEFTGDARQYDDITLLVLAREYSDNHGEALRGSVTRGFRQ
jgi:sigma-B regulation protein RsbU (phosphoserine phosphatase)